MGLLGKGQEILGIHSCCGECMIKSIGDLLERVWILGLNTQGHTCFCVGRTQKSPPLFVRAVNPIQFIEDKLREKWFERCNDLIFLLFRYR